MRRPGGLWDGGESLYLSQGIKGDENSSVKQTRGGVISGVGERTAEEHCLQSSLSDAAQDRGWQCLFVCCLFFFARSCYVQKEVRKKSRQR